LSDFHDTLQFKNPLSFRVRKSLIHKAGRGLFFCGCAEKNTKLCGYGGIVKKNIPENRGYYVALLNRTPFVIDASILKLRTRYYSFF